MRDHNTNTIAFDPCVDFDPMTLTLSHGGHSGDGAFHGECCLVEAANQATVCCSTLAERFGKATQFEDDHPSISPVVRSYAIGLNDAWTASSWMAKHPEDWKRLRPYVTKILGTKTTPEDEETRAWLATDWLVRVHTPAFLRLAGLTEHAQALEGLARIVDAITCGAAQPTLDAARSGAAAAGDAAGAAAGDAAWAAAGAAAGDAAWAAARAAAGDAAWAAAGDAARAAARAAAWDAAGERLYPTVKTLQDSALELFDALIAVGRP